MTRRIARSLVVCLLFAAILHAASLTPEKALSRRQITDVRFSPDGARIAVAINEPPQGDRRVTHIWMVDARTRELTQFTTSPKGESSPRWSPAAAGKRLAFLSNRDEREQIYLMQTSGGEAERLTEGKNAVRSFEWSPDGRQIAFLAPDPKTDAEEKKEKDKDDARVVDKDNKPARLWVVDLETRKVNPLTSRPWDISDMRWTPEGDRLIVTASDHPERDEHTRRIFSVSTVPGSAGELKPVASPRGPFSQVRVSPDGASLAYIGARVDGPSSHDLYVQPLAGGAARNLTAASLDRPIRSYAWRKDGSLLAQAETGFTGKFYVVHADGKSEPLEGLGAPPAGPFDAAGDGLAYASETAVDAPELWLGKRGSAAEKVTSINESWKQVSLIKPELVRYKSFDGLEIEGALLKPAGYREGVRVPLVVLVHGGPTGRWADTFEAWGQLLADRGYAILYPNIRGSVGYGHRFIESNRADWGGGDFKDVMAGVDFLIERGLADPERLGIGGWSYGGYMALWAVTQTQRFKASVSGAPMSDLASEFGTENSSTGDEWFYGTPYEKLDGFIRSSPITWVKNARTPTLLLQGDADTTDPIGQSQQFYRALKRYRVDSDFVVYPREGHGLREEKHLLDRLNRIVAWYDKYLKPPAQ